MPTLRQNGDHRKIPQIPLNERARPPRLAEWLKRLVGLGSEKSILEIEQEIRRRRREQIAHQRGTL
jgi:hypothetical protein